MTDLSPVAAMLIATCEEAARQGHDGEAIVEGVTTLYSYFLDQFVTDLPAFYEAEAHAARFEALTGNTPGPPRLSVIGGHHA